ncbi:hypothetical protein PSTG_17179 [Puccinia striiformis f. sp. tritici PST-78]|uniref:Uncharacterized protein n=1 Tax=Puccinia striiformis f. sp. tritici PST-78 TaxID=1165861 RepID=A0A0L0UR10_9BASI|nr:hypothetical protein PSTG_17179 [Puccinia striiformis f. sp. tritici PST-78]
MKLIPIQITTHTKPASIRATKHIQVRSWVQIPPEELVFVDYGSWIMDKGLWIMDYKPSSHASSARPCARSARPCARSARSSSSRASSASSRASSASSRASSASSRASSASSRASSASSRENQMVQFIMKIFTDQLNGTTEAEQQEKRIKNNNCSLQQTQAGPEAGQHQARNDCDGHS